MPPIKVLLLFREGLHHDFPTNAETMRKFMVEAGFDVTATGDFALLASPQLDSYDVILNFTFNHEINAAEEAGLVRFVADGKGLFGLHTATITFPQSAAYKEMIGGWLVGHAKFGEFKVTITDRHHPITAGLDDFSLPDELYACTTDPSIRPLATAQWKEKAEPMVWTKPYGKGRVCYVALGHDHQAFANANFRKLVCQAATWAAGRSSTRFYPAALFTSPAAAPKRKHRAAVVGSGNIARHHVRAYQAVGNIDVVAASDISDERLEWFKKETGVDHLHRDYMEMVRAEKPDLVSVCTWPDSHAEIVCALASSGVVKGILCEKPMAITMGEARQMNQVCAKHGVKLAINHMRRFYSQHQKAKDLIDSGAIGAIKKLWASVTTFYKDPFVWATHVTDMVRFYAGDVEWVMGQVADMAPEPSPQGGHRYCVNGVAYMKFASGARGIFEFEQDQGQIHVIGERGQLTVPMDITAGKELLASIDKSPAWTAVRHEGCGWNAGPMFVPAVHDLVEAVEDGSQPVNSGVEGAASLEILLGIFESARTRGRVSFPMQTNDYPLAHWDR